MKFIAAFMMGICLALIFLSILLGFNYPNGAYSLHPVCAGFMGASAAIVGYAFASLVWEN
jgi:hypothetical protein